MAAMDNSGSRWGAAAGDQAAYWFARLRADDCSEQERVGFAAWLAESEVHSREYARLLHTWQELDGLRGEFEALSPPRAAPRRRRPPRWIPLAAAAALLAALGIGWHGFDGGESYATAKGEQRRITLADGSEAHLGADSRIRVEMSGELRRVRLEQGQALFTVAHGSRPFEVDAGAGVIRDIGTRFDVRRDEDRVAVAVLEGEVEICLGGAVQPLSRGQQTHYSKRGLAAPSPADLETVTAWRQGKLVFDGTPLAEVVRELQRYHDRPIAIDDPALGALRVSGIFNAGDLDGLLATLQQVLPLKAERDGDAILLSRLPAAS